ncbi:hypothetical protein [Chitiniphilus shinanonensis]|uniref:hypothetical protein n=1 Tax=Chitiniphilus shinanonensis TaxID=553088 RepID=UPI0030463509
MQPGDLKSPSKSRLGRGLAALGQPDQNGQCLPAPSEWSVVTDQLAISQAQIQNLAAELQRAHRIISNALNIMTLEQKLRWGERNIADGVDGEGITRAHEREELLIAMSLPQRHTKDGA